MFHPISWASMMKIIYVLNVSKRPLIATTATNPRQTMIFKIMMVFTFALIVCIGVAFKSSRWEDSKFKK